MYENLRFPTESRLSSRDHHLADHHMLVGHAVRTPRTFTVDDEGEALREPRAADGTRVSRVLRVRSGQLTLDSILLYK